jgi:hypothetical protein
MVIFRENITIRRYEIIKDELYDFIVFSEDKHVIATMQSDTHSFVVAINKFLETNKATLDDYNIYLEE